MKRAFVFFCIAVFAFLAASCTPGDRNADTGRTPGNSVSYETETAKTLSSIPAFEGIKAEDAALIIYYGDSQPPDTPVETYAEKEDIAAQVKRLKGIRLIQYKGPKITEEPAPGDWWSCEVYCMDGRRINVSSVGKQIDFGEGYYTYENFAKSPPPYKEKKELALYVRYPLKPEELRCDIINRTGKKVVAADTPFLEVATAKGWESVKCAYGICVAPDPFIDTGKTFTYDLCAAYPDAGEGIYRLSLKVWADGKEAALSDVFVLK